MKVSQSSFSSEMIKTLNSVAVEKQEDKDSPKATTVSLKMDEFINNTNKISTTLRDINNRIGSIQTMQKDLDSDKINSSLNALRSSFKKDLDNNSDIQKSVDSAKSSLNDVLAKMRNSVSESLKTEASYDEVDFSQMDKKNLFSAQTGGTFNRAKIADLLADDFA